MKAEKKDRQEGKLPAEVVPGRIFQPFILGERFLVLPPYYNGSSEGRFPLILGPGKAFGSGEHETTASCLEFLEQIPSLDEKKVLDFGCGTGILAIAAARLGASYIIALDNDAEALLTCARNIAINGVEKQVFCLEGDLETVKEKNFDLILANIHDDIILKNSSKLASLIQSQGHLILSGISYESHYEVKTRFLRLGFIALKEKMMEEYCTFWWNKNP